MEIGHSPYLTRRPISLEIASCHAALRESILRNNVTSMLDGCHVKAVLEFFHGATTSFCSMGREMVQPLCRRGGDKDILST